MTKTILSVLFLTTILITASIATSMNLFGSAEAIKAGGTYLQTGPSKKVCGDQLCSQIGKQPSVVTPSNVTTTKPAAEPIKPAAEPIKPAAEPIKPAAEPIKPSNATETSSTNATKPTVESVKPITPMVPVMNETIWKSSMGTITSETDPGMGHETHQLALILPPSDNTYSGVLTYSAAAPVQLVALHGPLGVDEAAGQPTWTADGKTIYALTLIDSKTSMGSWEFSGNAIAVHSNIPFEFGVSYSVRYTEQAPSETVNTVTLTSDVDPGKGHESHQLAMILPPSNQTYSGVLTYSASTPVQLVALHGPLGEDDDIGQPTWTADGKTIYALTLIDSKTSMGSWEFSGNAIAVHSMNNNPFTVSYSVVAGQ